ncbi:MAG: hypothetical protein LBD91_00100 [Prevotellaceae bacterium]|jgi:hypothetical protein|nr:hypothetical protein [Prevotellaceae bacterium]
MNKSFHTILFVLCGFGSFCYGQSVVHVEQLRANNTTTPPPDGVWVFVDYQPTRSIGMLGNWTPATVFLTDPANIKSDDGSTATLYETEL